MSRRATPDSQRSSSRGSTLSSAGSERKGFMVPTLSSHTKRTVPQRTSSNRDLRRSRDGKASLSLTTAVMMDKATAYTAKMDRLLRSKYRNATPPARKPPAAAVPFTKTMLSRPTHSPRTKRPMVRPASAHSIKHEVAVVQPALSAAAPLPEFKNEALQAYDLLQQALNNSSSYMEDSDGTDSDGAADDGRGSHMGMASALVPVPLALRANPYDTSAVEEKNGGVSSGHGGGVGSGASAVMFLRSVTPTQDQRIHSDTIEVTDFSEDEFARSHVDVDSMLYASVKRASDLEQYLSELKSKLSADTAAGASPDDQGRLLLDYHHDLQGDQKERKVNSKFGSFADALCHAEQTAREDIDARRSMHLYEDKQEEEEEEEEEEGVNVESKECSVKQPPSSEQFQQLLQSIQRLDQVLTGMDHPGLEDHRNQGADHTFLTSLQDDGVADVSRMNRAADTDENDPENENSDVAVTKRPKRTPKQEKLYMNLDQMEEEYSLQPKVGQGYTPEPTTLNELQKLDRMLEAFSRDDPFAELVSRPSTTLEHTVSEDARRLFLSAPASTALAKANDISANFQTFWVSNTEPIPPSPRTKPKAVSSKHSHLRSRKVHPVPVNEDPDIALQRLEDKLKALKRSDRKNHNVGKAELERVLGAARGLVAVQLREQEGQEKEEREHQYESKDMLSELYGERRLAKILEDFDMSSTAETESLWQRLEEQKQKELANAKTSSESRLNRILMNGELAAIDDDRKHADDSIRASKAHISAPVSAPVSAPAEHTPHASVMDEQRPRSGSRSDSRKSDGDVLARANRLASQVQSKMQSTKHELKKEGSDLMDLQSRLQQRRRRQYI